MPKGILLGFELKTGEDVCIPLRHTAIFGMSQLSGKTTALEAIITRSGLRAVTFITKRGEGGFKNGNPIAPYYRPRSDWQFVEGLVNVALNERVKYEPGMRSAIMRACRKATGLEEIRRDALLLATTAKGEFMKSVFERLAAYLDIVVPELDKYKFSVSLDLKPGVNVMNLSDMRVETQQLVIASTIDYINLYRDHIIVVVPEAWEMLPQSKMTPVKWVAQEFIRKGAALGNYMFLDSMPDYETLFVRRNGLVETTTMETLFNQADPVSDNGIEYIREFHTTVEVLAPSTSRMVWRPIKHMVQHPYDGTILRINTKGGLLDVSPNHPIMKYPKYLVEAATLKLDDRLCMRKFTDGRYHNNDIQLFMGTEDVAWLYGFYAAEGWVNRTHVALANTNLELLNKAQRIIRDNFHLSASFTTPRQGVYTLEVASVRLESHFKTMCYLSGAKADVYSKMVPISILNAPLVIKKAFWEGYTAGDGYIIDGRAVSVVSASRTLVLGLTWLLHSVAEESTYGVFIRPDKPKTVQLSINKGDHNRCHGDEIKKIIKTHYRGYLYDMEVDSEDHTFYIGIGNTRVHNSQDVGGLDKTPLRQVDNWLIGRMKESNEIERLSKQVNGAYIQPGEIQTLKVGHFIAVIGDQVRRVYVLPAGVPEEMGIKVATGQMTVEEVSLAMMACDPHIHSWGGALVDEHRRPINIPYQPGKVGPMDKALVARLENLEKEVAELEREG